MRGSAALLLVGCGNVLFIDYPFVEELEAGTEIISIESAGTIHTYARAIGTPWSIPLEDTDARLAALVYEGTPEENGLAIGDIQPAPELPAMVLEPSGAFEMTVEEGKPSGWRRVDRVSEELELHQLAAQPVANIGSGLGAGHTCIIYEDRSARCFGDNDYRELGGEAGMRAEPDRQESFDDVVDITTGTDHTCILRSDGRVACFGRNHHDQLARDTASQPDPDPGLVEELDDVVELEAGREQTCALERTGGVACWGRAAAADPRDGALGGIEFPVRIEKIAVSAFSVCGLHDNRVHCAGVGLCGLLTGPHEERFRYVEIALPGDAIDVASGDANTCALLAGGDVYCWGCNGNGQSDPTRSGPSVHAPRRVLTGVTKLELGGDFGCGLHDDGTLHCWGANMEGELGSLTTTASIAEPVRVDRIDDVVEIEAFDSHACVRTSIGAVYCWGRALQGQLGNGELVEKNAPVLVVNPVPR